MASPYPSTRPLGLGNFHRDRSGPGTDAAPRDGPLDRGSLLVSSGHLLRKAKDELGLGDPGQDGGVVCSLPVGSLPI